MKAGNIVVHLLSELRPSGAEVMLKLAAPFWIGEGTSHHIVASGDQLGEYATALASAGYKIEHLPLGGNPLVWMKKWREHLERLEATIAHIHVERWRPVTVTGARLAGCRVYSTIHNAFPYSGMLRGQKILERLYCGAIGCESLAISASVERNEQERLFHPTTLCWNWFDSDYFRPPDWEERRYAREQLQLPPDTYVVVSVGNGNDIKNYDVIIEALARVEAEREVLYLQVGNEHPEKLERRVAGELGVMRHVRFCGPQSDVRPFLWAADMFLMPSKYEGFGLAAVEALACGLPCVFSDRPGLIDFRQLGVESAWLPPNAEALATEIKSRLRSGYRMITKNSRLVRGVFSTEQGAARYLRQWMV